MAQLQRKNEENLRGLATGKCERIGAEIYEKKYYILPGSTIGPGGVCKLLPEITRTTSVMLDPIGFVFARSQGRKKATWYRETEKYMET